jgi:hypothetical protein
VSLEHFFGQVAGESHRNADGSDRQIAKLPAMAEVRLWQWTITDPLTGKRRQLRYRMTEGVPNEGCRNSLHPHFRFERRTDQTIIAQHLQETRLSAAPR